MPDTEDNSIPEDLRKDILFQLSGFPVSLTKNLPNQKYIELTDFLDQKIINLKGRSYTTAEVISNFANNAGGAHYSKKLVEDIYQIHNLNAAGLSPVADALFQIGEIAISIGTDTLKKIIDLEIHYLIAIPDYQKPKDYYHILDCMHSGTNMQYSIAIDTLLKPVFIVQGHQGLKAFVKPDALVDWTKPRHLCVSHHINGDFESVLSIKIDDLTIGSTRYREPLFAVSDPLNYDCYHNRYHSGDVQNFTFGLGSILQLGRIPSTTHREVVIRDFKAKAEDPNNQYMIYERNSFGVSARGSKDIQNTGSATTCQQIHEYLNPADIKIT